MRSLATCYSEHAIKVSDSYCSSRPSNKSYFSPNSNSKSNSKPSILNSVSNIYQFSHNNIVFFLTLTWCKNKLFSHGFSISINDSSKSFNSNSNSNSNPQFLKKIKGSKFFNSPNSKIEVLWDLSSAHYDAVSPEPISGFYVVVLIDSEQVLFIGEETEIGLEFKSQSAAIESKLVSRVVQFSGESEYSTRAQFSDSGIVHDILIKCGRRGVEEEEGLNLNLKKKKKKSNDFVLCVTIDNKRVIEVKRLKWNFRGNQIIFIDGLLIDMMWDLHDWLFNELDDDDHQVSSSSSGYGVFMFRTRSGLDSRLWLEEKNLGFNKAQQQTGFSLFISACKNI